MMKLTDRLTPNRRRQLADLTARIKRIEAQPSPDRATLATLRRQRSIILEPILRPQEPTPERRVAAEVKETRTKQEDAV